MLLMVDKMSMLTDTAIILLVFVVVLSAQHQLFLYF
jgi:hypothetical protein